MAVRSRLFWLATAATNATTTLYTVPTDRVMRAQSISISNPGAGAIVATLYLDIGGGNVAVWAQSVPAAGSVFLPFALCAEEGHVVRIFNPSLVTALKTYGGGSLLAGDAS